MVRFQGAFTKKDLSKMSLITPRFGVALNWQNESIDGDYFIGSDEPNFMNVYSSNKIASTSEAELGLSSTLGFDYNISWYSGYNLEASMAVAKISDLTYPSKNMAGYEADKIHILGNFQFLNPNNLSFDGSINLNENLDIALSSLSGGISSEKLSFLGYYEFINADTDPD